MRFLSLRLKPKAAAAPRAGRGPGTGVDDDVEKGVDRVQTASIGTSVLVKKGCPVVGLKTRNHVLASGFHIFGGSEGSTGGGGSQTKIVQKSKTQL
jgi:hypothetical protein